MFYHRLKLIRVRMKTGLMCKHHKTFCPPQRCHQISVIILSYRFCNRCSCTCVCVCFRVVGGEAVLWEASGGTSVSERERNRISYWSVCDHAAGLWPTGRGEHITSMCLCVCVFVYLSVCVCDVQGLFRVAPSASKLKKLKASLDCGVLDFQEYSADPHAIAGKMTFLWWFTSSLRFTWSQISACALQVLWSRTCASCPNLCWPLTCMTSGYKHQSERASLYGWTCVFVCLFRSLCLISVLQIRTNVCRRY